MTKSRNINRPKAKWGYVEKELMRQFYPNVQTEVLAQQLGMTAKQVYSKAKEMGLKKSEAFHASGLGYRLDGITGAATGFKKGHQTWNKGLRGITGHHPNSRRTQFQKGRAPEEARNYQPIGTLRVNQEGYLQRKFTDDPSLVPARRWETVHRLAWMAANGPVPKGHVIAFKPGMRTNVEAEITLDRLECITLAENARRNSLWAKNPELMRLYQLKGAITNQVNRMKKEQDNGPTTAH